VLLAVRKRTLEVVEHREELLHEALVRERDVLLALAGGALLVVVEVGCGTQELVLESSDLVVAALLDDLFLPSLLVRHYDVFASSSTSSYSASSTTSSSADVAPLPPVAPACCCCCAVAWA